MPVRFVTDSTADLDSATARQYNIEIVPLTVAFGDKAYLDGVEIDTATFYERLTASPVLPKTSTPSVTAFESAYRKVIKEGATAVFSAHVSGALSGTLNAATLAAQAVQEETKVPIRMVDTRTVSIGFSFPLIKTAEHAQRGAELEELVSFYEGMLGRSKIFFVLDTLEYLEKGGRIGRAKAVFGTLLSVKPILTIKDGIVAPLESPRSRKKALERITELVRAVGPLDDVAIVGSDAKAADELVAAIRPVFAGQIPTFKLGAVVGTYAGPRAAGVVVIARA